MVPGAMTSPLEVRSEDVLAASLDLLGLEWRTYDPDWIQRRAAGSSARDSSIDAAVADRLAALSARDFAKADTIRADLLAQGIQLMDSKDPATGERRTNWEVKR